MLAGELYDQIQRKEQLTLEEARFYASEIVDVLAYLREQQVLPRPASSCSQLPSWLSLLSATTCAHSVHSRWLADSASRWMAAVSRNINFGGLELVRVFAHAAAVLGPGGAPGPEA